MEFDATFFAFVALVIFVAGMLYIKLPATIAKALDARAEKISGELAAAARLRAEAEALMAEYAKRAAEAGREAEAIVTEARQEAERLTVETTRSLEEMIARRTRAAEAKIAQAETQAIADVRARAADIAIAAAGAVIGNQVSGGLGSSLIAKSIDDVRAKLN